MLVIDVDEKIICGSAKAKDIKLKGLIRACAEGDGICLSRSMRSE